MSYNGRQFLSEKITNFKKFIGEKLPKNSKLRNELQKYAEIPIDFFILWIAEHLAPHKKNLRTYIEVQCVKYGESIQSYKKEDLEIIEKYLQCFCAWLEST